MDLVEVRGGLQLPPEVVLMRMGGDSSLQGKDLNRDAFARDSMPPQALPLYDPDVVARTALSKAEVNKYLPQLADLLERFPSLKESALIGGLGARIASNPPFRPKNGATDIDLFLGGEISDAILDAGYQDYLIDSRKTKFSAHHEPWNEVKRNHNKPVFKVPIPYSHDEADLFQGSVSLMKIPSGLEHSPVQITKGGPCLYVANRGVILATALCDDSFKEHRGYRARAIVESIRAGNVFEDNLEDAATDMIKVFRYNGLGRDELDLATKFSSRIKKSRGKADTTFKDFCQDVYNAL